MTETTNSAAGAQRSHAVPDDALRAGSGKAVQAPLSAERRRVQDRIAWLCRHAGDGRANGLLRTVVEQYRTAGLP